MVVLPILTPVSQQQYGRRFIEDVVDLNIKGIIMVFLEFIKTQNPIIER